MQIGFIGTGALTRTFGRHLTNGGHPIVVSNSRGPESLAGLVADLGPSATAGTKKQAAAADIVILATNWASVPDAPGDIDWRGRILVDIWLAAMSFKPENR